MIKKWIYYTSIALIVAFISFGFKPFKKENHDWFMVNENEEMLYHFPTQNQNEYRNLNIPFTGKFFIGYKEAIAFKESQGKYSKINSHGYLGKYQFGMETLRSIGINDRSAFLRSPKLQEKAFVALLSKNKWELKDEIEFYSGKVVGGIYITESGILAAAHLGGVNSVKKFFKSNGERFLRDGYGTSLKSYMRRFGGYETSGIVADSNATVE
ncbi:MAG TPA: hypothetical protein VK623_08255 [Flavobacterium sp.]|nr:hypothetical protein [Flavobacterium sp.]